MTFYNHDPQRIRESLTRDLNPNIHINELLRETGAVIAGGYVLKQYTEYEKNTTRSDIDFYVKREHAKQFIERLLSNNVYFRHTLPTTAAPYDKSFFYRNGILSRFAMIHNYHPDSSAQNI